MGSEWEIVALNFQAGCNWIQLRIKNTETFQIQTVSVNIEQIVAFLPGGAVERLVKYVNRNLIISDEYYEIIVELEALLPKKEGG